MSIDISRLEVQYTEALAERFDKICKAAEVHHGLGPPIAYFEKPDGTRYVYVAFGMAGGRGPGTPMIRDDNVTKVLEASVEFFRGWLKPRRSLLWREKPMMDFNFGVGGWGSYWRCVQLDDDARYIDIRWGVF